MNLNPQQLAVVHNRDKQFICLAGAGTGKTKTLIEKIKYLVSDLNVDPRSILVLTFTHNAAIEMKSRYTYQNKLSTTPHFNTFHGFCYHLITTNYDILSELGYLIVPDIISDEEASKYYIKAQMLASTKLPKRAYKLSYSPSPKEQFDYTIFQKTLDKLLIKSNVLTFDRLCYKICKMFEKSNKSFRYVSKYLDQYDYIFVDEFQDTDQIQWDFIQCFLKYATIGLFGDIRQAIYQFRGADSSILKRLVSDPNWAVYKLEYNYRSTYQICNFANNVLSKYNDDIPDIQLHSDKSGSDVEICTNFNHSIYSCVLNQSIAILCRTNKNVQQVCEILQALKLPYHTKPKLMYQKLCLAALDSDYLESLLIDQLPNNEKLEYIKQQYLNQEHVKNQLRSKFPDIIDEITKIQDSDEFGQIQQLFNLGELEFNLNDANITQLNSIYVGTIHSVKGLEFDTVYVYDANSNSFKLNSEENLNLYYVACTRAKSQLVIVSN